ncbi:hypothetical protein PpBr36_00616 [Pyricularia pennisetigena]|uniref:hypothetical protein n=1 Tax=Pyricularia pennisetigena TaxID=1578925 RepID=UPI0011520792|nr:hypothetical protein PpBr36_00616 [Pyricularia pennisetigena]TLS28630.1 hypothetical protein PpBr36_00616 [Pyricularia pennisetigena]
MSQYFTAMIAELNPWISIGRGCCGAAAIFVALVPTSALKLFGVGHSIRNKNRVNLVSLLAVFCFLEVLGFAILLKQNLARGLFPNIITFIPETIFIFATLIYAEEEANNTNKQPILLVRATFVCLLCAVELLNVVHSGFPRQAVFSLSSQLSSAINISKMTTCGMVLFRIMPEVLEGYKTVSEPDPPSPRDIGSGPGDTFGFQIDIQREAKNLGGWWPVLKRFRIFLEYMLPADQPLQMIRLVASFLLLLVHQVTQMHERLAFTSFLDKATTGSNLQKPLRNFLLLWAINITLPYIYGSLKADLNLQRSKAFNLRTYAKIISMGPTFHTLTSPTDLSKAMDDAKPFVDLFESIVLVYIVQIVGIIIAAKSLVSRHGFFLLLTIFYQAILIVVVNKNGIQKRSQANTTARRAQLFQERFRQDSLRGWATIFNYNLVENQITRYKSILEEVADLERNLEGTRLNFSFFQNLVTFCGIAAGYSIIVYQFAQGTATSGDLIFFIPVWQKLWYQFGELMRNVPELVDAFSDAAPLRRILEKGPAASARRTNGRKLECTEGSLELIDVSFTYPGMDKPVINCLSMTIKPATKVALLGPSGTGKTTLLKMFMRYLSPSNGLVLIDGQNVENIDQNSFHSFVGIVPQMPYIFNTTVMENIRVGKADASDEEVYEACRNAMIHDTIMARPHGYQTQIGEQGCFLSGGEKQRIEFARLFLRRPKVILLDEPTANLDQKTEDQVLCNLLNRFNSATIIMATHHVELVKRFDTVMVVGEGNKFQKQASF